MRHPDEVQLALLAGGDLNAWERWRLGRHLARCARCENELQALRSGMNQIRDLAGELPQELNWNRLAEEMTGNIRVGLAAGEAIARFDKPVPAKLSRLSWSLSTALACAGVLFIFTFWASMPKPQAEHLSEALKRIATRGMGPVQHTGLVQEEVVLEATSSGIEVKENGRAMSLMHPHSDGATVSVSMHGSAGVRFVDVDTGQVTTNKVYYAEP